MPDLSVFDVQRELRKHVDLGHDATQHPQRVHVEGKPYQLKLGTNLTIGLMKTHPYSMLRSYVTQSERPLISAINSQVSTTDNWVGVSAYTPTMFKEEPDNPSKYSHFYMTSGLNPYDEEGHDELRYKFGFHVPHKNKYDIHQVLQHHATHPLPYAGELFPEVDSDAPTFLRSLKDFPEPFSHEQAIKALIYDKPYSGRIHVRTYDDPLGTGQITKHTQVNDYFYTPHTEELHKVGERKAGE